MAPVNPTAAILVIGDEILSGETQDSNSTFLCARLTARGVDVRRVITVPDDLGEITKALGHLADLGYDFVLACGGIGPTPDDLTRQAVALHLAVDLVLDQNAVRRYEELRGEALNKKQLEMCRLPEGAQPLFAGESAAPGFRAGKLYVLPGVPSILHTMWELIEPDFEGHPLHVERFIANQRESDFAAKMEEYQNSYPELKFGSYPRQLGSSWQVEIRVRGHDRELLQEAAAKFMHDIGGVPVTAEEQS